MSTYKLVISGEVLPGHETEEVKARIASLFKLQDKPDQLETLFSGKSITVKKGLDEAQAQTYLKAIQGAGLGCEAISEAPEVQETPVEEAAPEPAEASDETDVTQPTGAESEAMSEPVSEAAPEPDQLPAEQPEPKSDASAWTDNPYQQPEADLSVPHEASELELLPPQKLAAGAGLDWLKEGFAYFKMNPWVWIGTVVIFWVLFVVTSMIPFVSLVTSIFMPVFTAGFMLACYELYQGEKFGVGELFSGFKNNFGGLVAVGVFYLVGSLLIMGGIIGVVFVILGASAMESMAAEPLLMALAVLIMFGLMVPLMMAYWFAPALVAIHSVPALKAMGMSFKGCLRNIVPFLVYGVIGLVLMIIASIPLMLGWLVLAPVMFGSMFAGYRQIFTNTELDEA